MKKILILFGGNSFEHNISCKSAKNILENIDINKFEITTVGISKDNKWFIYNSNTENIENWEKENIKEIENIIEFIKFFDVVFPVLHGANGEDGRLQGMLDMFNIKYVGCKTSASVICMDKILSKYVFSCLGIPQVPFMEILADTSINTIISTLKFPMIVKPANGGSSIGINKVTNKKELRKAIKEAKIYDQKVLVEEFIVARELECAILVDDDIKISNIGEIKTTSAFYDYDAKYNNSDSYTIIPANINSNISNIIKKYAKKAFTGVNASSLSRIDFLYDEINNKIYLNEINTLPGFTSISMFPMLFIEKGYSYKELITSLINNC